MTDKHPNSDPFLESLDRRIDQLFRVVFSGQDNAEPLTVQIAKVVENQREDRDKLTSLERKIDSLIEKQHEDLLEIKEAVYNLGTIGMFLKQGGWKLMAGLMAAVFAIGGYLTWTYDNTAPPRVFADPRQLEKLKDIIRVVIMEADN